MNELEQLQHSVDELLAELRRARREGLVVRIPDSQIDEISLRVLERVDERLAPRETPADVAPRRRR